MDNENISLLPEPLPLSQYVSRQRSGLTLDELLRRTRSVQGIFSRTISDIASKIIGEQVEQQDISLRFFGQPFDASLFSDAKGLLPIVIWRAEECATYCFDEGSARCAIKIGDGAVYEACDEALTGVKVGFQAIPALSSAYLLMVSEGAHTIADYLVERAQSSMSREAEVSEFVVAFRDRIESAMSQQNAPSSTPANLPDVAPRGRIII